MPSLGTTAAVKQEWVRAGGIETSYLVCGEGPPVILLHGSGPGVSAAANWQDVLPSLGCEYRVYAPDIVGFGETERPADATYDIKLWSRHLIGFMEALDLRRVALVGNSFGGGLSLAVTLRHPQRVSHLVLMGTPAGEFEQTPGLRSAYEYEPSVSNMAAMLRLFPYEGKWVTAEMIEARHEASLRHGGQAAFRKLIPPPNPSAPTIVRGVPETSLRTIQQPTLVLHGREDRVVPLQCAQLLLQAVPNCELHVFGQCGHWVQIEQHSRFIELVRHFLRSTGSEPHP